MVGLFKKGSNDNSNSNGSVYGAVIAAVHCHCESSPGSFDEWSTVLCEFLDQANRLEPQIRQKSKTYHLT